MANLLLSGVRKSFDGRRVLDSLDLDVSSGELLAVLGASGCGKTTLLRLISGFEHLDAGEITIDGQVVASRQMHAMPEVRRIGYVPQEGALFPHLTVADNVLFGLPRGSRRNLAQAEALLESVGLPASYTARAPHELSGGEQQRVALARALALAPRIVLLDEPFSALDAGLRVETRKAVAAALAAAGATALLVTHDQAEALSLGRRVAVLRDGRVAQISAAQELYRRPIDADLAQFIGDAVLVDGVAAGGRAQCVFGQLPLAVNLSDGPVTVMIRPEQILLAAPRAFGAIAARIVGLDFYGHDARVAAIVGTGLRIAFRLAGHAVPRPDESVWLAVEGTVMAFRSQAVFDQRPSVHGAFARQPIRGAA